MSKLNKAIQRFHTKYKVLNRGCWEWQTGNLAGGYPKFWYIDREVYAHRFSYKTFNGNFDKSLEVCHRCNNKLCVNPEHLYVATHAQNIRDAIKDGLFNPSMSGVKNPLAKLTMEQVREIREKYAWIVPLGRNKSRGGGLPTYKKIGKEYGISERQATEVLKNISYRGEE